MIWGFFHHSAQLWRESICHISLTYTDSSGLLLPSLDLKMLLLLHDVTFSSNHPLSGAKNSSFAGLLLPQQYSVSVSLLVSFNKKDHLLCDKRTDLKTLYFLTLTMQYTLVHHQYCCSPYYRTHTVSICRLFCSFFVNTVCKSTFEWQLR